jgi:hypothetical protein
MPRNTQRSRTTLEHSTREYHDLLERLHATLTVFENATHMSILDDIARLPETSPPSNAHVAEPLDVLEEAVDRF